MTRNISSDCNARVGVTNWYFDDRSFGFGRNEARVWSHNYVKDLSKSENSDTFDDFSNLSEQIFDWTEV